MNQPHKTIGIDLGTTNSVLAVTQQGIPTILPVQGSPLFPSVVGRSPEGTLLVGTPAWNQWVVAPERTVRSIKRRMGDPTPIMMAGEAYSPQEISALILKEIKQAAETALGHPVERAVITVPAYFNETQRQATLEAGEIAGLVVERIINEPTAAALAHGYGLSDEEHLRILVYDLGGGTFDVSVIELNFGVIDVLATAGDNQLGGDDFDERLATMLAETFLKKHKIDLREHHQSWARLLRVAEEAKIELSSRPFASIRLEYIAEDRKGKALHLSEELARTTFEEQIEDLLERTATCIDQALRDASLEASDIDRVLLVGGSTRIPAVWDLVTLHLGQEPHTEIDPDAAVAYGAAVQAGIIAGEEVDAVLVDVTPLSLGIETARVGFTGRLSPDHFAPLIHRNTTIPVQKSEVFYTLHPDQKSIDIKVYQGEDPVASANTLLGSFKVEHLKPKRKEGLAEVTIIFEIDINGILNVTVTDRNTGKQVREQLKASRQRLSPEQIAESQQKLAATHAQPEPRLDPGVTALLERASEVLQSTDLDPELAQEIRDSVDHIRQALTQNNEERAEEYCDDLIDLLMEVEA